MLYESLNLLAMAQFALRLRTTQLKRSDVDFLRSTPAGFIVHHD